MQPTDLALLRTPTHLSVSPDGRLVAVAVARIDLDSDDYRSAIWITAADRVGPPRQFTRGHSDTAPAWSPDGRWLAFLRAGADEPAQLHVAPADGGEARPVCTHPLGVTEFAWSPDSTRIAYTARVPEPGRYERGPDARPAGKEAPRRITRLRYRMDNLGFLLDRPNHVFVVEALAEDAEPRQLTRTDWGFRQPAWTPDGRQVVLASERMDVDDSLAGDVFAVDLDGGDLRQLTRTTTTVSRPEVAPDGGTVYYLGSDRLDLAGRTTGAFAVPFDGSAEPTRLTEAEHWDLSDAHRSPHLIATKDGLLALTSHRGAVELIRIPYDGGDPHRLTSGRHQVVAAGAAGGTVAVIEQTDVATGEVAVLDGDVLRPVTSFGAEFARSVNVRPMRELRATAPDGYEVAGWLVEPAGPGPHPVLLDVHGGPFTQYGYTMYDEAQVYAGAGYAVVLGNPRGASGYGEAHGRAIVGDWGNLDRVDLIALLDAALADPDLDASRVGVMGGSYGGYMTTWLSAHEGHRFRAAIVERALTSFDSFTGSSDIGHFFTRAYAGDDPEQVRRQTPLTYVDRIDLPVLIIHSEQDWRCPVEQAQRLFVALKQRGVDVEFLLFPGEGHELSRSGLPSHRVARFEAVLDWWARHLAPTD